MNDARVSARPRSSQAFTGRASSARAFRTAVATSTRLYAFRLGIDFLKIFDWLEAACARPSAGIRPNLSSLSTGPLTPHPNAEQAKPLLRLDHALAGENSPSH